MYDHPVLKKALAPWSTVEHGLDPHASSPLLSFYIEDASGGTVCCKRVLPPSQYDLVRTQHTLAAAAPRLAAALLELVACPNKHRPEEVWIEARAALAAAGIRHL
jgi:hypothetical protein